MKIANSIQNDRATEDYPRDKRKRAEESKSECWEETWPCGV